MSKDKMIKLNKTITRLQNKLAIQKSKYADHLALLEEHDVSTIKQAKALLHELYDQLKSMQSKRRKLELEIERALLEIGDKSEY